MLHRGTSRGPSISILHRKAIFGVDAEKDSGCCSKVDLFRQPFPITEATKDPGFFRCKHL
uniref:Uncharacterized protein n=1 Tax=Solanum lycopersicum TaxID=4081 RepID=A0A3Q7J3H1_SOLLC